MTELMDNPATGTAPATDEKYHGLTHAEIDQLGAELDALRLRIIAELGEPDAEYLRKVVKAQRSFEIAGRALFYLPWSAGWPPWLRSPCRRSSTTWRSATT